MFTLLLTDSLVHIKTETDQQNESITQNQSQTLPSSLTLSLQPQVSLSHSQIEFKEIIVENKIGVGSYGKVCLGKWNGTPVALKFCRKKGRLEDFIQEVKTMMYAFSFVCKSFI
jgi:hypothetical protein